jgi:hypothetical protein
LKDYYDTDYLTKVKERYYTKLTSLKGKLEKLNQMEEKVEADLTKFTKFDKTVDELFKNEIKQYKLNEDSI